MYRDRHPTCAMMVTPGSALRHRLTPDMGGQRMVLRKTQHEIQHMAAAGRHHHGTGGKPVAIVVHNPAPPARTAGA
jgi:hypothetical protein